MSARRAAMLAALATAAVAGASECADAYDENCLTSRCCQDEGYRCFKRDGVEYAQCRRYAEPCTTQNDVWLCPEEWCPGCWDSAATLPSRPPSPPLPPAPPPAPPPPPLPPIACVDSYEACWDSRCCADAGDRCYTRKHGKQYAQCMPEGSCSGSSECLDITGRPKAAILEPRAPPPPKPLSPLSPPPPPPSPAPPPPPPSPPPPPLRLPLPLCLWL